MDTSILYDILSTHLYPHYKNLVSEEKHFTGEIEELYSEMKKLFTEEQLNIIARYKHLWTLREENFEFQMQSRILNYGIKIGMDLQNAFNDYFNV